MCVAKVSCFGLSLFKSITCIVCFDIIFGLIAILLSFLHTYVAFEYNYNDQRDLTPFLLKYYLVSAFFLARAIAGALFSCGQRHTPNNRRLYFIFRTSCDVALMVFFLIFNSVFDDFKIGSQLYEVALVFLWVNGYTNWIIYSYWRSNEGDPNAAKNQATTINQFQLYLTNNSSSSSSGGILAQNQWQNNNNQANVRIEDQFDDKRASAF